jgi:preprotein translocase subunit SecA
MRKTVKARSRERGPTDGALLAGSSASAADMLAWCRAVVGQVGALEARMRALADEGLAATMTELRGRAASGQLLDDLLPETFALVREAAERALGQRHYDVQIMGGAVLHRGTIAEMRTGEGKTLTATLTVCLRTLGGSTVHVMTASQYLAERDVAWMRPLYEMLGLRVGVLGDEANPPPAGRRAAYAADVTYGVAEQFCFDYLRDHMALDPGTVVQRGLDFALVDEADLILVDRARAEPHISAPAEQADLPYAALTAIVAGLRPGTDYKHVQVPSSVSLTDEGARAIEDLLGISNLYDAANLAWAEGLQRALEAAVLYVKDRDYIVSDGQVLWLDPVSGRASPGLADDLRQALESKEGLAVRPPSQILAQVANYDYLKMYGCLAGMTGTAASDEQTYRDVYRLDVVVIPTHRPVIRLDHSGDIYPTRSMKLAGMVGAVAQRHATGQPVLIGAGSIEECGEISGLLAERGIGHEVLTAKNPEREAALIAAAGQKGAVTVVARMAGRGTDIRLGGPDPAAQDREDVADLGGLYVAGAERSLNKRVEMHLRGRAGRQGDPGESEFFASFEDEAIIAVSGVKGAALNSRMLRGKGATMIPAIARAIDAAQVSWAGQSAAMRRQAIDFDDVLAEQRRDIYAEREQVLTRTNQSGRIVALTAEIALATIRRSIELGGKAERCREELRRIYPSSLTAHEYFAASVEWSSCKGSHLAEELARRDAQRAMDQREAEIGAAVLEAVERQIGLTIIDQQWREHVQEMLALLAGIGLRAVGGRSPLAEYRREGQELFAKMRRTIGEDTVGNVFHAEVSVMEG